MTHQVDYEIILKRIDGLGREIECLRRDLLHGLAIGLKERKKKTSLFGSVRGGDITEEMIEEAKQSLFRPLKDL